MRRCGIDHPSTVRIGDRVEDRRVRGDHEVGCVRVAGFAHSFPPVHADPGRLALGLPLLAAVGEVTDEFLLLAVDADDRLTRGEVLAGGFVDVAELAVPVWMLLALGDFGRWPGGCTRGRAADSPPGSLRPMAKPAELGGEDPRRLERPTQRAHRMPAGLRLDQRVEQHE